MLQMSAARILFSLFVDISSLPKMSVPKRRQKVEGLETYYDVRLNLPVQTRGLLLW